MLFLPGFTDDKLPVHRNFQTLQQSFDIKLLRVPAFDRSTFQDLLTVVKAYIQSEAEAVSNTRPIYVLGESFGALLAIAVAIECKDVVDRVILINPATSFKRSPWEYIARFLPQIPEGIQQFAPLAFLPVLVNPPSFTLNFTEIQNQLVQALQIPDKIVPIDTLVWKLKFMDEGGSYVEAAGLKNMVQRTLIVTGDQDRFLPSKEEGQRLEKLLYRAKNVGVQNGAHILSQNLGVNLNKIIEDNGFYVQKRNMTSYPNQRRGNNFGKPGPIEVPNKYEFQQDHNSPFFRFSQQTVCPAFFSTSSDGQVALGLRHLPQGEQLLLIGNHQPTVVDFMFIVERIFEERGELIRTFAHPALFVDQPSFNVMQSLFTRYGVLPINPTNMYKVLQSGESAMLLPGGATEAFKDESLKHQLLWPENAEFVRMAAKFGVTIIPVSSTGAEEGEYLLSPQQTLDLPIIGEQLRTMNQMVMKGNQPRAWQGQTETVSLISFPVYKPGLPKRYYTKFGAPIRTQKDWVKDKEKCTEVYRQIKDSVEEGMSYLQTRRTDDPYSEFVPRAMYQLTRGLGEQVPTFSP
eukprot:TRINITY_DN1715_c0_g1_i9.p1 TRINITY_DN1715_c0_g1~~TRINITY_DN1715_c0_g1_i9.p1  ORF type:complete len:574 (-),score=37.94 TRINITY_DN1715_c0_g1_i9:430-2151(-)